MNDAFVYMWTNLNYNKVYIGYHKGCENDGYICSSLNKTFWDDFKNPEIIWKREILFRGSVKDCLELEKTLIKNRWENKELLYNNSYGAKIIWTEDLRKKLSESMTGIKHSKPNPRKGQKLSEETCKKMSNSRIGNTIQRGRKRSKETLEKMSLAQRGNNNGSKNKGIPHSKDWVTNQAKSQKGQKWYNNGKINKKFHPGNELPGYIIGKLKFFN